MFGATIFSTHKWAGASEKERFCFDCASKKQEFVYENAMIRYKYEDFSGCLFADNVIVFL